MSYAPIAFAQKFALFADRRRPNVVAEMNDYQFPVVRRQGEVVWHSHDHTDETFIVLDGLLRIDFRDGVVTLGPAEMFVVPRSKEHRPCAEREVKLLLVEPRGVMDTGNAVNVEAAPSDMWI